MKQYRQGDVLLVACEPPDIKKENKRQEEVVLAEGEATGHAHRLRARAAALMMIMAAGRRYVQALEACVLHHEEHGEIHLDPGWYEVRRQREYDAGEIRQVAD